MGNFYSNAISYFLISYFHAGMELNILVAILLTAAAGLATGIGGLLPCLSRGDNRRSLSLALGLAAGVLLYISFADLMPEAISHLSEVTTSAWAKFWAITAFTAGVALIALTERLLPDAAHNHQLVSGNNSAGAASCARIGNNPQIDRHLKRSGIMLAIAVSIHNVPEGIATFVTAMNGWQTALPLVAAIAIHNIPVGMAVSVPIFQATGSRRQALQWALLSGLSEPLGAILAAFFILPVWSETVEAICISIAAGIMVYLSIDELLPSAESHGRHHLVVWGLIAGVILMAAVA